MNWIPNNQNDLNYEVQTWTMKSYEELKSVLSELRSFKYYAFKIQKSIH